ncbi:MAG: response regulator, partial [candidate division Zixibacteria bacterium]|nr:response regulator [candidate division Zixibacteria bacterium]
MSSKILVVDDEDSMCNFMEIMLTKDGYKVETTTSGGEAINLLKDENFDLVIADLNMPEMSGIEVLKGIKSFKREQEIIMMTAFASVDTAIEAMKLGPADYIPKPLKIDEIKLAIEKAINRKKLLEENTILKRQLQGDNSFDKFIGK